MDINDKLEQPLDPKHVCRREGKYDYIEGWHAIDTANKIFGHLGWSRETTYCMEVSREEYDKSGTTMYRVGYEAKVRITVDDAVRDGTGHGDGRAKMLYDAIEMAAKEAETDATKRALMTFGYPLGLALYDKKREHVQEPSVEVSLKLLVGTVKFDGWEPAAKQLADDIIASELEIKKALIIDNHAFIGGLSSAYQDRLKELSEEV